MIQPAWRAFRRFWTAEEVPRWFGLSLVIVYLAGLGYVAHFGVQRARQEGRALARSVASQAARVLASSIRDSLENGSLEDATVRARVRARLSECAAGGAAEVRLVDASGVTVLSSRGDAHSGSAFAVSQAASSDRATAPLLLAGSAGQPTALAVEVVLPRLPQGLESIANQANALVVVLLGFAALFLLYRRLRDQLRPVTRIAERLQMNADHLEEGLATLQIHDMADNVTSAWNQLVDMTKRLADAVQRTQANDELAHVLKLGAGSALHDALHAHPDGLIYITAEVKLEYVNAAACRLLGWPVNDTARPNLADAKARGIGEEILRFIRESRNAEGSFTAQHGTLEQKASSDADAGCYRIWVAPPQRGSHEGECLVVIRDVSQQVRAERARDEFVTQVTHELRTPLTNIRAYAETLSSGMFDDPKVITECYNVITKETRRLSRLIEDVLSMSQFEVGSLELHYDQVDLKSLLTEAVRDVRGLADEKNIDLQLVLPAKMEPVRADRDKLAVVVNNLLGNAIKYTRASGTVIAGAQYSAEQVVLTVKDNGIGIDAADHARVFEKFQRGSDPDALSESGSGIGLYTAREIARRHGGDIELISQKGQGSTFLVRLPHLGSRAATLSTSEET